MVPDSVAGTVVSFVGVAEGLLLSKTGSAEATHNPGLNPKDKKNGKTEQ